MASINLRSELDRGLTNIEIDANFTHLDNGLSGVVQRVDAIEGSVGANSGLAQLDSNGKLLTSQVPDLAITDHLGTVANQTAMLALSGQRGDWAIRSDTGTVWIITGSNPSQIGSWTQVAYPAAPVASVAGKTGAVTLVKGDVGLGNVDNTSDAAKPISTATQTALDGKAATSHDHDAANITSGTVADARLPATATRWPTYAEVTGKPTNFTPSSHSHDAANITSGTIADARLPATATRWPTHAEVTDKPATATRWPTWAEVTGKPTTFAPSAHNHDASAINAGTLSVARGGTGIASYTAWNYIRASGATALEQRTPAQVLSDIGAAAASHTHVAADLSGTVNTSGNQDINDRKTFNYGIGVTRNDGQVIAPTTFTQALNLRFARAADTANPPGSGSWGHLMTIQGWQVQASDYPTYQMIFRNGAVSVRQSTSDSAWAGWRRLVEGNGVGASGTWGISITGSAASATNATEASSATQLFSSSRSAIADTDSNWMTWRFRSHTNDASGIRLSGSNNSWRGTYYGDGTSQGFLNASNNWVVRFNNGSLTTGTVPWEQLTGRPSTFAPSAHNHDASAITSGTIDAARLPRDFGAVGTYCFATRVTSHGSSIQINEPRLARGDTVAGNQLIPVALSASTSDVVVAPTFGHISSDAVLYFGRGRNATRLPSGTWRLMGETINTQGFAHNPMGLWLRIE